MKRHPVVVQKNALAAEANEIEASARPQANKQRDGDCTDRILCDDGQSTQDRIRSDRQGG
jgi:hypothetical protein